MRSLIEREHARRWVTSLSKTIGERYAKRIVRLTNRSETFSATAMHGWSQPRPPQSCVANSRHGQWHATRADLGSAVLQLPHRPAAECGAVHWNKDADGVRRAGHAMAFPVRGVIHFSDDRTEPFGSK